MKLGIAKDFEGTSLIVIATENEAEVYQLNAFILKCKEGGVECRTWNSGELGVYLPIQKVDKVKK